MLVRDAADIRQLSTRIATLRQVPRVEFDSGLFPRLAAQRAQERFAKFAESCKCLLGEMAGAITLLGGLYATWVSGARWYGLVWVGVAVIGAMLLGRGIESAWLRVRMLLVLGDLQRRLESSQELPETKAPGYAWLESGHGPMLRAPAEMTLSSAAAPPRKAGAIRPRVEVSSNADITRLCLKLFTRWSLPRVEFHTDGIPVLEVQRAQYFYDQLSGSANFLLAGLMAVLTLLGGLLYVLWQLVPNAPLERLDLWLDVLGWSDVWPVLVVALFAGVAGWLIELAINRVRLLRVLRNLQTHGVLG